MNKLSWTLILTTLIFGGCAKEKEYEKVYKTNTYSKNMFSTDPNDPYVYLPSVENTPMNVTASRPYWMGEPKLVTFRFNENSLEVLEIPTEKRFAENENNFSPVFKIDIEHKGFRCKEDEYGECSNEEEEIDDISWSKKGKFEADFSKLTVLETNTLPEQLTNLFANCFADRGSIVKKVELEKDSLNIQIERTMSSGIECADIESFEQLRNLTFKITYHYSFVKLSKLASKDYKAIKYPSRDQNTFGFFSTTTNKLSTDNRTTLDSDVTYLNRWNPEKKVIKYYLSEDFEKPEFKAIKKATHQSISSINKSLQSAGTDVTIKLESGKGKNIGDLNNSFIVLVKDPQASGVIGYGPSVANPITGEIVKGQVVMYYGTIRKYIQETYDELVAEAQEEKQKTEEAKKAAEVITENGGMAKNIDETLLELHEGAKLIADKLAGTNLIIEDNHGHGHNVPLNLDVRAQKRLKEELFSHSRIYNPEKLEDMMEEMSRHNMYHQSMFNWHGALASSIQELELNLGELKPWNDLTEEEREQIIEKLMPSVWIPTLVHEFGHNLGLRHNFNGSEDKENFYTTQELNDIGSKKAITYSSIMDYSYSSLNQLSVMGKYDIAALRFGYNRQVEAKDGATLMQVTDTLSEAQENSIKSYKYCTDEHVAVNASCKRFDEGSTLSEIAQHHVDAYNEKYEKRNKRNKRLNFNGFQDADYYMGMRSTFQNLRIFFESYDRINSLYPGLSSEQWESIEFLKDLRAATKIALKFYLDVLKTPSVHCAVADKKTGQVAAIVPLESITFEAITCFDDANILINKDLYTVIAETGKHFNHAKNPYLRGDIKADASQIDVRGLWIDKMLAADFLFKREIGISTFDTSLSSFIDYPDFQKEIMAVIDSYVTDSIEVESEFKLADGTVQKVENSFAIGKTHNITRSFHSALNKHLKITKPTQDFKELFIPIVKQNLSSAQDSLSTLSILKSLELIAVSPTTPLNNDEIAATIVIKDANGAGNTKFAATHDNKKALELISLRNQRVELEKFTRTQIVTAYLAISSEKIPEVIEEALKPLYAKKASELLAYLNGQLPADDYLYKIFTVMSK